MTDEIQTRIILSCIEAKARLVCQAVNEKYGKRTGPLWFVGVAWTDQGYRPYLALPGQIDEDLQEEIQSFAAQAERTP